uniref:Uncharacterized protein n=1 Tax=Triticum urartu TaxID=4572 RepID=A0A8R7QL26_TRIUA
RGRAGAERAAPAPWWRPPARGGGACGRQAPAPSRTRSRRRGTGAPASGPPSSWSPADRTLQRGRARGSGGHGGGWSGVLPEPGTTGRSGCTSCTRTHRPRRRGASSCCCRRRLPGTERGRGARAHRPDLCTASLMKPSA